MRVGRSNAPSRFKCVVFLIAERNVRYALACRDATNQGRKGSEVLNNSGLGWLRHDKTDAYRTFFADEDSLSDRRGRTDVLRQLPA